MLLTMIAFTGCASTETELEYNEVQIEEATEFLIQYCNNASAEEIEQWNKMTEFELEQQLTAARVPFTPESFLGSFKSWEAGVDECGEYLGHGDFVFEASKDELKVTTEAEYAERNATIELLFDENLYLESMTISAHFTTGEILKKAGLNTILGMGTVFAVLIFISIIISLFKYIPAIQAAFSKKSSEPKAEVKKEPVVVAAPKQATDDLELIAVISAAIAAAEGTSTDGFVVRSIKRRKSNKWN